MRNKKLIAIAIGFFLVVNTSYYWEGKLGVLAFILFFVFIIVYFLLGFALISQIYLGLKQKPIKPLRLVTVGVLSTVLVSAYFRPHGLIDFSKFEAKDVFIVQREGVASCMTTFRLKENCSFKERTVCFGVDDLEGTYRVHKDTIFFDYKRSDESRMKLFKFALIQQVGHRGNDKQLSLTMYRNLSDTRGIEFEVVKNELIDTSNPHLN